MRAVGRQVGVEEEALTQFLKRAWNPGFGWDRSRCREEARQDAGADGGGKEPDTHGELSHGGTFSESFYRTYGPKRPAGSTPADCACRRIRDRDFAGNTGKHHE
ncbi:hypothetical protein GCM10023209_29840 [Roseibacterium beibuensis]|uniref:Uncharacterized protein n=1 Tax=[Roseibacterium] beibuensis TaxID=1193142 RepID=A0ABP9LI03_9RHOB